MANLTSQMINVRYFAYGYDESDTLDIIEIDESTFIDMQESGDYQIDYERHSIFENGVRQICLTVQNSNNPIEKE